MLVNKLWPKMVVNDDKTTNDEENKVLDDLVKMVEVCDDAVKPIFA